FPGYTGKVHFTSTDAAAVLPADYTFVAGDNGIHSFNVTLKTGGSQTVTVTDLNSLTTPPLITGTTAAISTRGLVISGLAPRADGFTVTFSKPIATSSVSLYGGTVAAPIQNVTLTGKNSGPVNGTLVVDPSGTIATFKASSIFLSTFFSSTVL